MSELDRLVDQHTNLRWTEAEIATWIKSLPIDKRNLFLDTLKKAKQAGHNVHEFACQARARVEQVDKNRPTYSFVEFLSDASIGWTLGGMIGDYRKGGIKVQ